MITHPAACFFRVSGKGGSRFGGLGDIAILAQPAMSDGGVAGARGMSLSIGGTGPSGTKTATEVGSSQVSRGEGVVGVRFSPPDP